MFLAIGKAITSLLFMQRKAGCANLAQKSPRFGQMCKRCAESVQPLSCTKKERQIFRFDVQNPCRNRAPTLRQMINRPIPHRLDGIGLSGRTARSGSLSRAFPLRTDLSLFQRFSYERAILGKAGARDRHDNAVIACGRTPEQEVLFIFLLHFSAHFCGIAAGFARWLLQTGWKSCWHPQSLLPGRSR